MRELERACSSRAESGADEAAKVTFRLQPVVKSLSKNGLDRPLPRQSKKGRKRQGKTIALRACLHQMNTPPAQPARRSRRARGSAAQQSTPGACVPALNGHNGPQRFLGRWAGRGA